MCRRGYSKKGVLFCVSEQVLIRALSAEFSFCRESKRCGIAHAPSSTHTKCGNLGQNCVAPNAHSTGVTVPCDRLCVSRTLGRWNRRFHRHTSIQRYRTFAGVMRGICADATGLYGGFCAFRESSRLACNVYESLSSVCGDGQTVQCGISVLCGYACPYKGAENLCLYMGRLCPRR